MPRKSEKAKDKEVDSLMEETFKHEKETNMKKFLKKVKTPLTVLLTLLAVAVVYAFYQWSFDQGVQSQKAITQQVEEQVAVQLKTNGSKQ